MELSVCTNISKYANHKRTTRPQEPGIQETATQQQSRSPRNPMRNPRDPMNPGAPRTPSLDKRVLVRGVPLHPPMPLPVAGASRAPKCVYHMAAFLDALVTLGSALGSCGCWVPGFQVSWAPCRWCPSGTDVVRALHVRDVRCSGFIQYCQLLVS